MVLGICQVEVVVYESSSLKEKRQVILSICQKVKSKFPVSIAEVDYVDKWQRSMIGFSIVSKDAVFIEKVMTKVITLIEGDYRLEVTNIQKEIEKVSWE